MSKNIAHPLTEDRVAELWDEHVPLVLNFQVWTWGDRLGILDAMCAAHDAGRAYEREHADDGWEPLNEDDPLNVGDEVRRVLNRITTTAVVASVDEDGNPWAVGASVIGIRRYGTWYVRRAAQELPTASCTVIIPADGRKRVEAKANIVWYANEAVLGPDNRWHGVWRTDSGLAISSVSPGEITPGTWKVADQ